ncbi:uncharacterized protein LOC111335419 [Stylophora pistillata]|uniref:uncharacterized protein LOC111335419 n=1 Tax=Stylophora pistillata TaxID=50429 RepID=UPI000C048C8C|nr:uncharacterized protein LOC111335419 [Stylophora pistillata]
MARSFREPELKTNVRKSCVKNECPFGFSRSPVTRQKRDVSEVDNHRQRAIVEKMKDAFRTISFRSEPTIGEEDLVTRRNSRTPISGRINSSITYALDAKKRDELVQSLVPECYEHLQNFHHYRNDMERLNSGCKVLYLSAKDGGKVGEEKELQRVYGQASVKTECWPRRRWNNAGSNARRSKMSRERASETVAMESKKDSAPSARLGVDVTKSTQSNLSTVLDFSDRKLKENDCKRGSADCSKLTFINGVERVAPREYESVGGSGEVPSVKLEEDDSTVESPGVHLVCCSHSAVSDISPNPPMPTPELDSSRGSSVRTLVFESQEQLVKNSGNQSSLRRTVHKDLKPSPHLLSPFQSRFPHLKCSELASSHKRHDRNITAPIPPWQQYRILCDAFRPTQQKNTQSNRYKMPKFATSTELEYYIDIVSETNNNCGWYFS